MRVGEITTVRLGVGIGAKDLNAHHAAISTDSDYVLPLPNDGILWQGFPRRGPDIPYSGAASSYYGRWVRAHGLVPAADSAGLLRDLVASLQPLALRLSCLRFVEEGHHLLGG